MRFKVLSYPQNRPNNFSSDCIIFQSLHFLRVGVVEGWAFFRDSTMLRCALIFSNWRAIASKILLYKQMNVNDVCYAFRKFYLRQTETQTELSKIQSHLAQLHIFLNIAEKPYDVLLDNVHVYLSHASSFSHEKRISIHNFIISQQFACLSFQINVRIYSKHNWKKHLSSSLWTLQQTSKKVDSFLRPGDSILCF
jgi:hypothetical protein